MPRQKSKSVAFIQFLALESPKKSILEYFFTCFSLYELIYGLILFSIKNNHYFMFILIYCMRNFTKNLRFDTTLRAYRLSAHRLTLSYLVYQPGLKNYAVRSFQVVKPSAMSFCSVFCVDYVYIKAEIEIGSLHTVFGLRKSPNPRKKLGGGVFIFVSIWISF